ncbi:MAG: hypothetical protein Q9195_007728 [Heterodermia aff. obscurata]
MGKLASNGCTTCEVIWRIYRRNLEKWFHEEDEDMECFEIAIAAKPLKGDPVSRIRDLKIQIVESGHETRKASSDFVVWAGPDIGGEKNPARQYLMPGMNPEVASAESFATALSWIRQCTQDHSCCPKPQSAVLPTRVIDVDIESTGPEMVRLHQTEGAHGTYTALSYCWGMPRQPVETTTTTLYTHMRESISMSTLPHTIRDAVEVTRRLGVRYLWVDSLCIVQDDREDKTREISQMRQIYSNAYCTISAASVSKVTESFLRMRSSHRDHVFSLPYVCPDGRYGTMMIGETMKLRDSVGWARMQFYDPYADPINQRAWTLEEKLLSPRILIYASGCLRWLCDSDECTDGGDPDARLDTQAERLPFRMQASGTGSPMTVGEEQLPALYERWRYILQDYTNRYLTKSKDKLRAISGVADYFHRLTSDQYLAGIWKADLVNELVWVRAKELRPRTPHKAPSWSWASVSNPVYFLGLHERREFYQCKILRCEVTPLSSIAPFGEAQSGILRLTGLLKHVPWDAETEVLLDSDGKSIGSAIIDAEDDRSLSASSRCLAVSALRRDDEESFYGPCGLILSPVSGGQNCFSRIGAFVTSDRLLFEGTQPEPLVIV